MVARRKTSARRKRVRPEAGAARGIPRLSHLDDAGRGRMVDVSAKSLSQRRAVARGRLRLSARGWQALRAPAGAGKGDPLAVAQLAAVMAAKKAGEWIPLAHPLPIESVDVRWRRRARLRMLEVEVGVGLHGRTGVEMEALTACSAALLCVYDMLKAVDRGMVLGPIWLSAKSGGRSGDLRRADPPLR